MSTMIHSAQHAEHPAELPRFVPIFAELIPGEVIASRRARKTFREVLVGLVAVLLVLLVWFALARLQTANANSDLGKVERQANALQREVHSFGPLITAQSQSAAIAATLSRLMVGDLQWAPLLSRLQPGARSGVEIDTVSGIMTPDATGAPPGGLSVLNKTGKQQVGTLTVNGTAPDKNSVAAYVDGLTKVTGLAAPFPASVAGKPGNLSFSISVIITSDAFGGRFTPTAPTVPGGH